MLVEPAVDTTTVGSAGVSGLQKLGLFAGSGYTRSRAEVIRALGSEDEIFRVSECRVIIQVQGLQTHDTQEPTQLRCKDGEAAFAEASKTGLPCRSPGRGSKRLVRCFSTCFKSNRL